VRVRFPVRSRRSAGLIGAGFVLASGISVGAYMWPEGRSATETEMQAAESAIRHARDAGANRWAPEALAEAVAGYREAIASYHRERSRFRLARDYSDIRSAFRQAERQAAAAAEMAGRRLSETRAAAEAALDRAERSLDSAEFLSRSTPSLGFERTLLRRSRIALEEARSLADEGDFPRAALRANEALAGVRQALDRTGSRAARYVDPDEVRKWREWIDATVDWSRRKRRPAIVVYKDRQELVLLEDGEAVRSFVADIGSNSLETKRHAGDEATPEGRYRVESKLDSGRSIYYKALRLDYPNRDDVERFRRARREGRVPKDVGVGSAIEIHGEGGRGRNWTRGCVAISNASMDELFERIRVGTPVTIVGGDGSGGTFSDLIRWGAANGESR